MLPTKSMANNWMSRKPFLKTVVNKAGEVDKVVAEMKAGETQVSI